MNNFSVNNFRGLIENFHMANQSLIQQLATEVDRQLATEFDLHYPTTAAHIDFEMLGISELPINLNDCDVIEFSEIDGELLVVTKYHDTKAMQADAEFIKVMKDVGAISINGLTVAIVFSRTTSAIIKRSIQTARLNHNTR